MGNPGRLFGSPFSGHDNFVRLQIGSAERIREKGTVERYYGSMRGDFIEVHLSAGQFAELITTMNSGMGTPCTIHRINNQPVEPPPEEPAEMERVRSDFKHKAKELAKKMTSNREEVRQLMEKKALSQQDRKDILRAIDSLIMEVGSNMPFMLQLFAESTEKVVQHAKAEVDAFLASSITAKKLEALAAAKEDTMPLLDGVEALDED